MLGRYAESAECRVVRARGVRRGGVWHSLVTLALDHVTDFDLVPRWLTGDPQSALFMLSTVATSMVSLTALVLTITMVVVQLAMGQFSPRIVETFLRDRPSQFAIGVFVATCARPRTPWSPCARSTSRRESSPASRCWSRMCWFSPASWCWSYTSITSAVHCACPR